MRTERQKLELRFPAVMELFGKFPRAGFAKCHSSKASARPLGPVLTINFTQEFITTRCQRFEFYVPVALANEQHFVMRHRLWRLSWNAGEMAVGEHVWILPAQLLKDDADLFGREFFAGEGILETPPPDKDQIG